MQSLIITKDEKITVLNYFQNYVDNKYKLQFFKIFNTYVGRSRYVVHLQIFALLVRISKNKAKYAQI